MSTPVAWPSARSLFLLAIGAAAAVLLTHSAVVTFGLRFDEYIFFRPFGRADVWEALSGNWGGPGHFEDPYLRPLTSLYFAALFSAFGLNTPVIHAISLVELTIVVWLLAVFLWRDFGPRIAVLGACLYVIHPVLPDSTSAWALGQMHLLALTIVLCALLAWQSRRHDPRPGAWWTIFALAIVGLLVKEDTVMILPAALALQWCRARIMKDVPTVTRGLFIALLLVTVALALARAAVFPHFDTFDMADDRTWRTIATVVFYGPLRTGAVMFLGGTLAVGATVFVLALQASAARMAWRQPASREGWLWLQGLVLLACFSVPVAFAFDIKSTRQHLTVLAASLMMTAGAATILSWRPARRWMSAAVAAFVLIGAVNLASMQRTALMSRFPPCSEEVLWFDQDTRAWPVLNDDLKRWFDMKQSACANGRDVPITDAMDVIQWPVDNGQVLLVNRHATSVSFVLHSGAAKGATRMVRLTVDGARRDIRVEPGVPANVDLPLHDGWRVRARAGHRIDIQPAGDDTLRVTDIRIGRTSQ